MRTFSFRPAMTMKGRKFKGPRGFAGKPFHPPLTDIPVGAYVIAPLLDAISFFGKSQGWSEDMYHAATYVLIAGAAVSVLAAFTGFWDWLKSTEKGTQARRTANAHMLVMVSLTVVVLVGIVLRLTTYQDDLHTPGPLAILGAVIALMVSIGGTLGGSLTYDYGFNVETAGDSPVWHQSEQDVLPGQH